MHCQVKNEIGELAELGGGREERVSELQRKPEHLALLEGWVQTHDQIL